MAVGSRQFENQEDLLFLHNLVNSSFFPFFVIPENIKIIASLRENPKVPPAIYAQLSLFGDDEMLKQIEKTVALVKEGDAESTQELMKAKLLEIQSQLNFFKKNNYKYTNILEKWINDSTTNTQQLLHLLEKENLSMEDFNRLSQGVEARYERFLIEQKDWIKLNRYYQLTNSHHYSSGGIEVSKVTFHYLLDKAFIPTSKRYEGGGSATSSVAMMRSIAGIEHLGLDPQLQRAADRLQKEMPKLLTNLQSYYRQYYAEKEEELLAKGVVQQVQSMKEGEQICYPPVIMNMLLAFL
jgi:hypothetical protein